MQSYLIHIYHRNGANTTNSNDEFIGIVEGIEDDSRYPFTNRNELWDILIGQSSPRFTMGTGKTPGISAKKGRG